MLRSLFLLSLFAFVPLLSAEEPKVEKPSEPKPEANPAEVSERPGRDDFLILPLRVYRLRAEAFPAAHTKLAEADVERIVKKVNRVWSYAGITFGLESIREEEADFGSFSFFWGLSKIIEKRREELQKQEEKKPASKEPEKKEAEKKDEAKDDAKQKEEKDKGDAAVEAALRAERNSRHFAALIPEKTKAFDGFRVYYIQEFDVNGIYYGRREAMVKATAALRKVEGGIDEPLPRVTAHELGHGLGLPHRQDRTNLMQSGTTGTSLNTAEVKTTRGLAEKVPGLLRYRDLAGLIEKETNPAKKAMLEKWKAAVEEQTK